MTGRSIGFKLAERPVSWGNGCGHDPENPAWIQLVKDPDFLRELGRRPKITRETVREFTRLWWNNPRRFRTLHAANGSPKQTRSEIRDAQCIVMALVVMYCDFLSFRVGIPYKTHFDYMDRRILYARAARYGISKERVDESLQQFEKAGYITLHRRSEYDPDADRYTGKSSVIRFTEGFFALLGQGKRLKIIRRWKSEHRDEQELTPRAGYMTEAHGEAAVAHQAIKARFGISLGGRDRRRKPRQGEPPPPARPDLDLAAYTQRLIDSGIDPKTAAVIAERTYKGN